MKAKGQNENELTEIGNWTCETFTLSQEKINLIIKNFKVNINRIGWHLCETV